MHALPLGVNASVMQWFQLGVMLYFLVFFCPTLSPNRWA